MNIKHIISYSGGLGSAISAVMVSNKYGVENTLLLFADTLIESPDLYDFNKVFVERFKIPIVNISEGRTPWEVFRDVKYIGNTRVDPCSRILKRDLIKKWLKDNYTPNSCNIYVGIDCSEEHRLSNVIKNNAPYIYRSILIENNIFLNTKDKIQFCKENNLPIPILYTLGLAHNNCGGFCVKAGLGQFKKIYEKLPEVYKYHEDKMEELILENPNLKPFLRKMIDKKQYYLTLKQYREQYLEKSKVTEEESLEFGGCGCAID